MSSVYTDSREMETRFLFITHVEKEGPFLKVWGQPDKKPAVDIELALQRATAQFDSGMNILKQSGLVVGVLCCAKYNDKKYYRARITSVALLEDSLVEVFFLDFGFKDLVHKSNLRSIECFNATFISLAPIAISHILAEAVCIGGQWNEAALAHITKDIRNLDSCYIIVAQAIRDFIVKIYIGEIDLALHLISAGLMQRTSIQTQEAVLLTMMPKVQQPTSQDLLSYKAYALEPGTQHPVYVSYVTDGPCHFSVQLKKYEKTLGQLMHELNASPLKPLEEVPLPGTVCLAKCIEDDTICRAVVTNDEDNLFKVFYVDFGNTERVPIENLYQITFKHLIPKVMAIRLSLAGIEKPTVTIDMACAFKEFVDERLLMMEVLPAPTKLALPKCKMWDPETNMDVLEVINRAAVSAYPEPQTLSRGFKQQVKISYVYSCNRFYVQVTAKETELANLMNDLQGYCSADQNGPLDSIKFGLPCCALFSIDMQWYRALILEDQGETVKVRYVDYGNEEDVPIVNLKPIYGELLTVLRPQAIECCLNGYQNMTEDQERDNFLEELILEQKLMMKVVDMISGKALVELITTDSYNVASLLLDKIAAARALASPKLAVQGDNRSEHRENSDGFRSETRPPRDQKFNNDRPKANSWRQQNGTDDGGFRSRRDHNNDNGGNSDQWNHNKNFRNRESPGTDYDAEGGGDHGTSHGGDRKFRDNRRNNNEWNNRDNTRYENRPPREQGNRDRSDRFNNESGKTFDRDRGGGLNFNNDSRKPQEHHDRGDWNTESNNTGDWNSGNKADGYKKKQNFRREGSEVSSSGSEKSFKKGPRTSSRNDNRSERPPRFDNKYNNRENTSFNSNHVGESSWDASPLEESYDQASDTAEYKTLETSNLETQVNVSWFHNPCHFFIQFIDRKEALRQMMEDIQQAYKSRKPTSAKVGAPVVALFPDDKVVYRARVMDVLFGGSQYKVHYVDFGNVGTVSQLWPIETRFMELPEQAICCGLNGIEPPGTSWPNADDYGNYFEKDQFTAQFVTQDQGRHWITLNIDGKDVGQSLFEAGLAKQSLAVIPEIEIPLLVGQQFRAMLKSVNGLQDFSMLLQNGTFLNCAMHNLIEATETNVDDLRGHIEQILIVFADGLVGDKLEVTLYDQSGNKLNIISPDEGAYDTVDPLCPYLVSRSTLSGYVSHVNENSVVIQPTENADNLAILLEQIYEHYENTALENPIVPEENSIYVVKSSDGNWYRGRVTAFEDATATVTYLDYGNSEDVGLTELRELTEDFIQWDMMALQVYVITDTKKYQDQDIAITVYYGETGWEGEIHEGIVVQAQDVIPVQEGIITEKLSEDIHELTDIAQPQSSEVSTEESGIQSATTDIISEEPTIDVVVPTIGSPVFVSHIDSPSDFYIQLVESLDAIEELQIRIQEAIADMPDVDNLTVGALCAAPYSVDQQWYRAAILDTDDNITAVRFVDFGNSDVIDNEKTKLKTLTPDLLALEVSATRCRLKIKPSEEEWSTAASERFELLSSVDNVTVEFIVQDEKVHYVELYSDGVNVKDVLVNEHLAELDESNVETELTGFISHMNSPSEFWIQLENCIGELESIAEQLSDAENFPELEDVTPGALCVALFPDDLMWYRGRILSNTVAGLEVLFLDYGNSCISSNLRELPEDLVMLSPLAQKCSLQKPADFPNWSQEATDKFATISAEGQTIFTVKRITTGETSIVELLLHGEDVTKQLVPLCVTEVESTESFKSANLDPEAVEKPVELDNEEKTNELSSKNVDQLTIDEQDISSEILATDRENVSSELCEPSIVTVDQTEHELGDSKEVDDKLDEKSRAVDHTNGEDHENVISELSEPSKIPEEQTEHEVDDLKDVDAKLDQQSKGVDLTHVEDHENVISELNEASKFDKDQTEHEVANSKDVDVKLDEELKNLTHVEGDPECLKEYPDNAAVSTMKVVETSPGLLTTNGENIGKMYDKPNDVDKELVNDEQNDVIDLKIGEISELDLTVIETSINEVSDVAKDSVENEEAVPNDSTSSSLDNTTILSVSTEQAQLADFRVIEPQQQTDDKVGNTFGERYGEQIQLQSDDVTSENKESLKQDAVVPSDPINAEECELVLEENIDMYDPESEEEFESGNVTIIENKISEVFKEVRQDNYINMSLLEDQETLSHDEARAPSVSNAEAEMVPETPVTVPENKIIQNLDSETHPEINMQEATLEKETIDNLVDGNAHNIPSQENMNILSDVEIVHDDIAHIISESAATHTLTEEKNMMENTHPENVEEPKTCDLDKELALNTIMDEVKCQEIQNYSVEDSELNVYQNADKERVAEDLEENASLTTCVGDTYQSIVNEKNEVSENMSNDTNLIQEHAVSRNTNEEIGDNNKQQTPPGDLAMNTNLVPDDFVNVDEIPTISVQIETIVNSFIEKANNIIEEKIAEFVASHDVEGLGPETDKISADLSDSQNICATETFSDVVENADTQGSKETTVTCTSPGKLKLSHDDKIVPGALFRYEPLTIEDQKPINPKVSKDAKAYKPDLPALTKLAVNDDTDCSSDNESNVPDVISSDGENIIPDVISRLQASVSKKELNTLVNMEQTEDSGRSSPVEKQIPHDEKLLPATVNSFAEVEKNLVE